MHHRQKENDVSDFTQTKLAGTQVLVEGTDNRGFWGQQVLDSTQWEGIKARDVHSEALAKVDEAIATLIAPVTAAIEAATEATKPAELDPLFYVVESEETEHVAGSPRLLSKLNPDSVILRALEEGLGDRLIWVNDKLTVTAQPVPVADKTPLVPGDAVSPEA